MRSNHPNSNQLNPESSFKLYLQAVQHPENEVFHLSRINKMFRKKPIRFFKEDFCSFAANSCEWLKFHPKSTAVGVDLDERALDFAHKYAQETLTPKLRQRLILLKRNVLASISYRFDLICALNFSYNIFKRREDLKLYFKQTHRSLEKSGLFVLDVMGGFDCLKPHKQVRKISSQLTYTWECLDYNILNAHTHYRINFRHKGKLFQNVFTYDWRLWSLPELVDLLKETGFNRVEILWEKENANGQGTGKYYVPQHEENIDVWICYLVAQK